MADKLSVLGGAGAAQAVATSSESYRAIWKSITDGTTREISYSGDETLGHMVERVVQAASLQFPGERVRFLAMSGVVLATIEGDGPLRLVSTLDGTKNFKEYKESVCGIGEERKHEPLFVPIFARAKAPDRAAAASASFKEALVARLEPLTQLAGDIKPQYNKFPPEQSMLEAVNYRSTSQSRFSPVFDEAPGAGVVDPKATLDGAEIKKPEDPLIEDKKI